MSDGIEEIVDLPAGSGAPTNGTGGPSPWAARPTPTRRPSFGAGAAIVCDNLVKIYKVAELEVVALQGLDLLVDPGEFIAIVGASGSGKSTLLNVLAGLDTPSAGRAVVADHDLGAMKVTERTRYRRRVIGFVRQQTAANLLPYLTARENVEMPMLLDGVARGTRRQRATALLDRVGLGDRADHRPDRLSGGEQQRVSVAVALANTPPVLLADEPTGELDTSTSREVFSVLRSINEELEGDDRGRDPRPARRRARATHGRDPRWAHLDRDAAPRRGGRRR